LRIHVKQKRGTPSSSSHVLKLEGEQLNGKRYEHLRLHDLTVIASVLNRCAFVDVHAPSVCFGGGVTQSRYYDCLFDRCEFTFSAIGNARLERCRFDGCRLENIFGVQLELIDCEFVSSRIRRSVFHGSVIAVDDAAVGRTINEFRGNDFSSAELADVDFRGGIDLAMQRLPTGDEYLLIPDTRRALEVARELVKMMSSPADSKTGRGFIQLLEMYEASNQKAQLMRIKSWGRFERELRARISSEA